MTMPLLHIFRNTPFGRETLLQSAYFCRRMQLPLYIYIPQFKNFLPPPQNLWVGRSKN